MGRGGQPRAHSAELQLLQGAEGISVEQLLEARCYIIRLGMNPFNSRSSLLREVEGELSRRDQGMNTYLALLPSCPLTG